MTIKINHVSAGSDKDGSPFLECVKPCKCLLPLLCCNRPFMEIYLVEPMKDGGMQRKKIG